MKKKDLRSKAQRKQKLYWLSKLAVESVINANLNTPETTDIHILRSLFSRLSQRHDVTLTKQELVKHARSVQHYLAVARNKDEAAARKRMKQREWSAKRIFATALRNAPTEAERALHEALTKLKVSFQFQPVKLGFIPDFYIPKGEIIIEADGAIHKRQQAYDQRRDDIFKANGILTVRIPNERIMADPMAIAREIKELSAERAKQSKATGRCA